MSQKPHLSVTLNTKLLSFYIKMRKFWVGMAILWWDQGPAHINMCVYTHTHICTHVHIYLLPNSRRKRRWVGQRVLPVRRSCSIYLVGPTQSQGHLGYSSEFGVFSWAQCRPTTEEAVRMSTRYAMSSLFHEVKCKLWRKRTPVSKMKPSYEDRTTSPLWNVSSVLKRQCWEQPVSAFRT